MNIKKITAVLFALSLFTFNSVQAKDYSSYCSDKTASKTFSGTVSSVFGVNAVKRNVIEGQIKKALEKKTGAKINVDAATFYGVSPTSGIFKSLKITGNNLNYDGLHVSKIEADTICPYNQVLYEDKTLHFVQNVVMKYSAEITEADINKSLLEGQYGKIIQKINSDKAVSALLKINDYNIKIKEDKLLFNYGVSLLPKNQNILSHLPIKLGNINISFSSGLAVKDGEVQLLDFGLNNNQINYGFLLPLVNKFNPTSWDVALKKDYIDHAQVDFDNITIKNSKIVIDGAIIAKADI